MVVGSLFVFPEPHTSRRDSLWAAAGRARPGRRDATDGKALTRPPTEREQGAGQWAVPFRRYLALGRLGIDSVPPIPMLAASLSPQISEAPIPCVELNVV